MRAAPADSCLSDGADGFPTLERVADHVVRIFVAQTQQYFAHLDAVTREVNVAEIDEGMKAAPVTVAAEWERLTAIKKDVGVTMMVQGKNGEQLVLVDAAAINRQRANANAAARTRTAQRRIRLTRVTITASRGPCSARKLHRPALVRSSPLLSPTYSAKIRSNCLMSLNVATPATALRVSVVKMRCTAARSGSYETPGTCRSDQR